MAHCTCTAGFGECCNHIVAVLYKVEFANTNMLIDPACTSEACVWNKTTRRDVEASRIRDVVIRKHEREKADKKRVINSEAKKSFDPRPSFLQGTETERLSVFLQQLNNIAPTASILLSVERPAEHDYPLPLPQLAQDIIKEKPNAAYEELVTDFQSKMVFNDNQLTELEKVTRSQAGSKIWRQQRSGCITATKIRDVFTKVNAISRSKAKAPKITPLLGKLLKDNDIGMLPAIEWGRKHEEDAKKPFSVLLFRSINMGSYSILV